MRCKFVSEQHRLGHNCKLGDERITLLQWPLGTPDRTAIVSSFVVGISGRGEEFEAERGIACQECSAVAEQTRSTLGVAVRALQL